MTDETRVFLQSKDGEARSLSVPGATYHTDADGMIAIPPALVSLALHTNLFEEIKPEQVRKERRSKKVETPKEATE